MRQNLVWEENFLRLLREDPLSAAAFAPPLLLFVRQSDRQSVQINEQ